MKRTISKRWKVAVIAQEIELRLYFRSTYEHDLNEMIEVREFTFNSSMKEKDLQTLIEYKADFNLFFRGEFIPVEILQRIPGIKIAFSSEPLPRIINNKMKYTSDSIGRYHVFNQIRDKTFDYVFHYDEASLSVLKNAGLHLSGSFPFPVATQTYTYKNLPKIWDIFFVGRSTPHRESYFMPLKHYYNFLHICHGIWGSHLVDYINLSKISLNIHAENEVSWEPRVQMMLAMKAFVISEKLTPNPYLRPGTDYIEVKNPKEILDAVSYYLNHEEERMQIASSGFHRVKEMLNSRTNFMELFRKILAGDYSKFRSESTSLKFNVYLVLMRVLDKLAVLKRNFTH